VFVFVVVVVLGFFGGLGEGYVQQINPDYLRSLIGAKLLLRLGN